MWFLTFFNKKKLCVTITFLYLRNLIFGFKFLKTMKTRTNILLIIVLCICLVSCKDSHDYRKQWTGKYHFVQTLRDEFCQEGDLYVRIVELEVNKIAIYWKENNQSQYRICTVEPDGTVYNFQREKDEKAIAGLEGNFEKNKLIFREMHVSPGGASITYQYDCKKIKDK